MYVFHTQPEHKAVSKLGLAVYGIRSTEPEQLELFQTEVTRQRAIAATLDRINDKYGEFTITPATMTGMHDLIIERVPFGSTTEIPHLQGDITSML